MRRIFCLTVICLLLSASFAMTASAISCQEPNYCYMTITYTGTRHNVKARFTGIQVHSNAQTLNNSVTNTTSAYHLERISNDGGDWSHASAEKADTSSSATVTAWAAPLTQYVTKGKASCRIHCNFCNSHDTTSTGEQSAESHASGVEFDIPL